MGHSLAVGVVQAQGPFTLEQTHAVRHDTRTMQGRLQHITHTHVATRATKFEPPVNDDRKQYCTQNCTKQYTVPHTVHVQNNTQYTAQCTLVTLQ